MIYLYNCSNCNETIDIYKPMRESGKTEYCTCGTKLSRVYTVPMVNIAFTPSYDRGLGEYITSSKNKQMHLDAYERANGSQLIEVGDAKLDVTPRDNKIKWTNEQTHDMHNFVEQKGLV